MVIKVAAASEGIERFFGALHSSNSLAVRRVWENLNITAAAELVAQRPFISMALPTRGGLISDRIAIKSGIHARTTFAEDSEEDVEALTQLGGARPDAHLESPSTRAARHAISSARES